jgi:hypothetical protein
LLQEAKSISNAQAASIKALTNDCSFQMVEAGAIPESVDLCGGAQQEQTQEPPRANTRQMSLVTDAIDMEDGIEDTMSPLQQAPAGGKRQFLLDDSEDDFEEEIDEGDLRANQENITPQARVF